MLDKITFLESCFTEKPIDPILRYAYINEGIVQISNGKTHATVYIPEFMDISCLVDAKKLLRAMKICGSDGTYKQGKTLTARKGSFSIRLNLLPIDNYPFSEPPMEIESNCDGMLDVINLLLPFIGEAGKTALWSCGIRFTSTHAYATNNVILIRADLPLDIEDDLLLPKYAVEAIAKIAEDPTGFTSADNEAYFIFGEDKYFTTILVDAKWPDADKMLPSHEITNELPDTLHEDIRTMIPFCDDTDTQTIILEDDRITTAEGDSIATLEGYSLGTGKFRARPLALVLKIASHADFSQKTVPFAGHGFKGVLAGLKG